MALADAPESLCAAIVERMPHGLCVWQLADASADPGTLRLVKFNPAASRLLGVDLQPQLGRSIREIFPEAVRTGRHEIYAEVAKSGAARGLGRITRADRKTVDEGAIRVHAIPLPNLMAGVFWEQLTADENAQELGLSAFLDSVIENIPAMVFVKDAEELRFVRMNKAGEAMIGLPRSALLGKTDFDFFPREQAEFFQNKDRRVLQEGRLLDIAEEPIQTPQGTRWLHTKKIPIVDARGRHKYLLGISQDVTEARAAQGVLEDAHRQLRAAHAELESARDALEHRVAERTVELGRTNEELLKQIADRQRAEEALRVSEGQLRQAQKMEAVGRLAGGVAHDFNNILTVVLSYCSLLLDDIADDSPMRADIEEIRKAGERAAELTRQLLAFSRQQVFEPKILDLNEIIRGMDRMLQRLVGEDVELRTVPKVGLGKVKADAGQIEQVLMNLVVNARDAMPEGGLLTIETDNVVLDENYAVDHFEATPGPHVMVAVSDTGHGMDKATLARIFDPFFTTKERGKGTGLGLSTVFGIVRQSGGSIWVYSEVGRGTTFKVYLPRTDEIAVRIARPSLSAPGRGSERILLVEDEEQVRVLAANILRKNGYDVLEARTPSQALQLATEHAGAIDLLLSDLVMPQISGRRLAERVSTVCPKLKVLFMSGYTGEAALHRGIIDEGIPFLQKPLRPQALVLKVREVLDARV